MFFKIISYSILLLNVHNENIVESETGYCIGKLTTLVSTMLQIIIPNIKLNRNVIYFTVRIIVQYGHSLYNLWIQNNVCIHETIVYNGISQTT